MGKIAFVFPGQGAQKAGMGKSLYEGNTEAKTVFDALEAVRPGTLKLCFEGPEDALSETKNTQPCLFAVELAAFRALSARGVRAGAFAGFSLGEVAALAASGAVSAEEGFRLVALRGELMQAEAEKMEGAMAAVLMLTPERVEALCRESAGIVPVNYNCPGQISCSGPKAALPEFLSAVKAAGGRAVPLKVKGAFHSVYMEGAADAFGTSLADVAFTEPSAPLYSNKTGLPYDGAYAETLAGQIKSPVRWQAEIEHMLLNGFDTFVELGCGKTLSGLIGKISATARTIAVEDRDSLERAVAELC